VKRRSGTRLHLSSLFCIRDQFCQFLTRTSHKKITNLKIQKTNKFKSTNNKTGQDLEERTFQFAKRERLYSRNLLKNTANTEDTKQVVRASGSVDANYIEVNEALSKK
jgi:hypothetical protein